MRTTDELEWDLDVDFLCVGAGTAGLAAAIVAVDAGASVFVANFGRSVDEVRLDSTLAIEFDDRETSGYLAALTEDLEPPVAFDAHVPVLAAGEVTPVAKPGKRDQVPPFYGGRLGDWAAECVGSPFGIVYSRVVIDPTTPIRKRAGSTVEVALLGSLELDPDTSAPTLDQWLASAASARDIGVHDQSWLQRLVFEEGEVVGAVFNTPTATLAVAARHGVMLACDANGAHRATPAEVLAGRQTTAEVCLVREPLSRFSRLELHVRESTAQSFVSARSR